MLALPERNVCKALFHKRGRKGLFILRPAFFYFKSSTFLYLLPDEPRDKHQKKIRSKTQDFLNLYAADGLRTLCIAKKVSTSSLRSRFPGEGFSLAFGEGVLFCFCFKATPSTALSTLKYKTIFCLFHWPEYVSFRSFSPLSQQVLSKEDYACWLKSHIEAESSIDNREELLFQSATRLETDLHLLGNNKACIGDRRAPDNRVCEASQWLPFTSGMIYKQEVCQ